MATYYVSSVDGSNSDAGTSWALAVATLEYAVETLAATGGPHTILVDSAHSESLSADTTIVAAQDLRIISVNRSGGDVPLAGATIGAQATNYAITLNGAFDVYVYGVKFQTGTNTTSSKNLSFGTTDGGHFEFESCSFFCLGTGATSSAVQFGGGGTNANSFVKVSNGTIKLAGASHRIFMNGNVELISTSMDATSANQTALFQVSQVLSKAEIDGCDFSTCTNTLVGDFAGTGLANFRFRNCKLGAAVVMMAAPTSVLNRGQTTVEAFNCNSGDAHYSYYHGDAFGETTVVATPYLSATSGGSNVSYKVVTRASNCSFFTPYVGPWIAKPHTGTSAVTPSFEILRDGSSTAYQDDEVWGEWSYQGTSGSTRATIVSDRMTPLGTPANQATGALGASDWTGENATAWFGKLAPASTITPAEAGHIMGRVVVGEPGITLYYDPTVRIA